MTSTTAVAARGDLDAHEEGDLLGLAVSELTRIVLDGVYRQIYRLHGPEGVFARTWSTGAIAIWAVLALWGFLLFYFWER